MQSNLRCPHHLLMLFLGASLALLRDGKSHLLALVLALMIELGQRMGHGLIIVDAVAEGVDGLPDGMSESGGVGLTLARNGILSALTRGRTHQRQSAEVVDAVLRQQRVEGCYALVMIHGEDAVECGKVAIAKELIGAIWAKHTDILLGRLLDGGNDGLSLFLARMGSAMVRVERQHGDART